jgi:hypothetical protein
LAKAKKPNKLAAAAAAGAAAAIKASQDQSALSLTWSADDDEDDQQAQVASEILEDLEQIDEEQGGDVTWELYCDTPLDKAGQIKKLARSELKTLRDECLALGPGQYHVVAREPGGTFVKRSRRNIKISGFARPTAVNPTPAGLDPITMMQMFEERAERRAAEARRERDAQIRFWGPLVMPVAIELAKGLFGRGGGESMKDIVGALVGMKDLVGATNSSDKAVETLLKGMDLARELSPPDSKGATWPDVVVNGVTQIAKEFRPLAEALANRRAAANGQPALQFHTAPATSGEPAGQKAGAPPAEALPSAAAAPGAEDPMLAMVNPLLRKLAGELEEFAVNGADPTLAADALMAKVPRLIRSYVEASQLKEWLMQPNWWPLTVQFHPALQPYQAYCDDVRLALLEAVEDEINPPAEDHAE